MTFVHIKRRDRADHATDLERCGLASYTTIVDFQPNILTEVGASLSDLAQCAACNLVDFLRGAGDLERYAGLTAVRSFFALLPDLLVASRRKDVAKLRAIGERLGAARCYEVVIGSGIGQLAELPRVAVVRAGDDGAVASARSLSTASLVILEPDRRGPSWLAEQLARVAFTGGAKRVLLGYHQHAAAIDHFSAFVETPEFAAQWESLLTRAQTLGLDHVGLAMALPACATLQHRQNVSLERMRAQLDMQFRRMDAESSMMCPENVSGYSLHNDVTSVLAGSKVARRGFALRHGELLFSLTS